MSAITQAILLLALAAAAISEPAFSADDLTKPIRVSPDGHFLVQPDGKPFFYLSENVETLFWRLNQDETDLYLHDRAQKGFSVILAQVVPKAEINTPNAFGARAFIDDDIKHPNPKYFAHVDWVISRAEHYGLRVALAPAQGISHVAGDHYFNESNAEAYGRWLGERYRNKGIIWVLGWDSTPLWPYDYKYLNEGTYPRIADFRPVYDLMAKGIAEGDGERPFMTFHITGLSFSGTPQPRTSLYFHERAWLAMNTIQSSHFLDQSAHVNSLRADFGWNATFNYEPIRDEFDSQPTRPVIDLEPPYEDIPRNLDDKIAAGRFDQVDIRNSAYHAIFAGAAGHAYNNLNIVGFHTLIRGERPTEDAEYHPNMPWKDALNVPGAQQIGYLKQLMLSRPYLTRVPDQSVIVGETGSGSAHISGTRDRTGSYLMIYLPEGQAVTVDMNKLSGNSASVWWFDPRTGTASHVDGNVRTDHQRHFTPPSQGHGNDWILVLDDAGRNFPAPGTAFEQP
jgi:hypothetical protein